MPKSKISNTNVSSIDCSFPNRTNKWDFQLSAARKIVADCENKEFIGSVLAGSVGCGKSQILIHSMNILFERDSENKILYLAHAQGAIRQQTLDAFADPKNPVKPNFSFGRLESGNQVEVAIPQEFYTKSNKLNYSHAIIDESHQWFSSKSVIENIISRLGITKLILASGTVSLFNRYNSNTTGRTFAITYISGEQMLKLGVYSSVDIDLVKVDSYQNTTDVIDRIWTTAKLKGDSLERPIFVCRDSSQADLVTMKLKSYGRSVAISTSTSDPDGAQIQNFKNGKSNSLVLLNRGILGLNFEMASSMIYLKQTKNIEAILQALARMYRLSPSGQKKYFWMPATKSDWNHKVILLHKTLSLMKLEVMASYQGNRFSRTAIRKAA